MKGKSKGLRLAFCLLLCLVLSAQPALGADGLTLLRGKSIELNDQLTLVENTHYNSASSANAAEHYFEYTPGGDVLPLVCYGAGIYGVNSARYIFNSEEEAGNTLVGLANGGFFVMSTGVPIGPVIRDGVVRSSGYGESVIAFAEDGSVRIGDPSLNVSLSFDDRGTSYQKNNFNKALTQSNGFCLYNADFGATNAATIPTFNVYLRIVEGSFALGDTLRCVVENSGSLQGRSLIPEGCIMISIAEDTPYVSAIALLRDLQKGESVTLGFSVDSSFEGTEHALGFERWLVRDGLVVSGLETSGRAPRTAAGIRADGSFVLYTVDGRQKNYSMGMSFTELAERMRQLGCMQAVNLDGGASTQLFAVLPGESGGKQINVDSDASSLRSCANYICFANYNEKSGEPRHLHMYPYGEYVLAGASISFETKATDAGYFACDPPDNVSYYCDRLGTMDGNVFTAGSRAGVSMVFAQAGRASGSVAVNIVADPSDIRICTDGVELTKLSAGIDKSYPLAAKAYYLGEVLRSDPQCYTWSVSGDIGAIDEDGVFTASGKHGATGTITVSAGSASASIAVTLQQTLPAEDLQAWIREIVQKVNE